MRILIGSHRGMPHFRTLLVCVPFHVHVHGTIVVVVVVVVALVIRLIYRHRNALHTFTRRDQQRCRENDTHAFDTLISGPTIYDSIQTRTHIDGRTDGENYSGFEYTSSFTFISAGLLSVPS